MILNTFWKVILAFVILYYFYVGWVILSGKKLKYKKNKKNDNYLQINDNFVNNALYEQSDLDAILNQVDESVKNSKVLEAFKKGSESADNNSLTHQNDETFKVIRNTSVDKKDPDSGT